MLSAKRDGKAAARFFRKMLMGQHTQTPQVMNPDKHAAYPAVIDALQADETIDQETELRQNKYLNHRVEQDHRSLKGIVKPMMGLKTFNSARRALSRIEAMNMIRKRQVKRIDRGNRVSQTKFIEAILTIAVQSNANDIDRLSLISPCDTASLYR